MSRSCCSCSIHTPLADTLLVAERLNVAQNARQDLERQPSKLVDLGTTSPPRLRGRWRSRPTRSRRPPARRPPERGHPPEGHPPARRCQWRTSPVRWPAGRPARRPSEPPARGRPARRLLVQVRRPARVPRPPLARRLPTLPPRSRRAPACPAWKTAAIRAYLVCVSVSRPGA